MKPKRSQLSVWALVVFTFMALCGAESAFAWDNAKPRAEAAGWFCEQIFNATNTSGPCANLQEVKFGITAKLDKRGQPDGRFEYLNHTTKYSAKGKITFFEVKPDSLDCAGAFGAPLNQPSAHVKGQCDDGSCTDFEMTVVDDDSQKGNHDWVCNVHIHGMDKKFRIESNDDGGQPLQKGKVEVHPENH